MSERPSHLESLVVKNLRDWPGALDRMREISQLDRSAGEPLFFLTEDETGNQDTSPLFHGTDKRIKGPIAIMLQHLFPNFTEEDFDRIGRGEDTEEEHLSLDERLAGVKAMVHFHPDNAVEPSMEDIGVVDHLHQLYSNAGGLPPLQVIGRINQEGKIDLLALRQIADLPSPEAMMMLPRLVEKYILLRTLPNYYESSGHSDIAKQLRENLAELEKMDFPQFIENYKQLIATLPHQEIVESFRTQFRLKFTVFPEYLSCVQEAVSELGCFKVDISTIEI